MKEEYINPFLVPAKLVWKKELGVDLELAKATKVSHQFTTDAITAVIGVSGALEGNVLYGFHEDTARSVVSKMMESEITEFDVRQSRRVAVGGVGLARCDHVIQTFGDRVTGWNAGTGERDARFEVRGMEIGVAVIL